MRLIDADALKNAISKPWMDKAQTLNDVLGIINAAPTLALPTMPEGWAHVPVESTWEMQNHASETTDVNSFIDLQAVWTAMLKAAPKIQNTP